MRVLCHDQIGIWICCFLGWRKTGEPEETQLSHDNGRLAKTTTLIVAFSTLFTLLGISRDLLIFFLIYNITVYKAEHR